MGNLYNRIEGLCAKQGISAYRLCKDIGIRGSVLSDLRTGRKQGLSSKTLTLIAEYFGVSIDYLLGKEEAVDPKEDCNAGKCNLYEQIQQACKKSGLTVSAMCLALGMSKSTMSDLKSGRKKTLSSDTIAKIAEFLNVTADELIFGREYKEEAATPKDDRSAKEAQAMELFSRLSPEEQEIVLAQLRGLTDGR